MMGLVSSSWMPAALGVRDISCRDVCSRLLKQRSKGSSQPRIQSSRHAGGATDASGEPRRCAPKSTSFSVLFVLVQDVLLINSYGIRLISPKKRPSGVGA